VLRNVPRSLLLLVALAVAALLQPADAQRAGFAAQIAELSEPPGYFDTDNLISNERSYLDVVPALRALPAGGAYIGVGPDQNFTYIAATRPAVAFIVDVRRDNLLLHLLFKALFQLSASRGEYLALLFGRAPPPADSSQPNGAALEHIVRHVQSARVDRGFVARTRGRVEKAIAAFGVPLAKADWSTIASFHDRFIEAGLDLQFQSTGRPPQSHYPTYRELLLARDANGTQASYLGSDDAFLFVKGLQARDLVVPVVGDLSGPAAVARIGAALERRGVRLSAFYVSNVEFYLFGDGTFPQFAANLRRVPHTPRSVVVRSVFGRYSGFGRGSTSHVHGISALIDAFDGRRIRTYRDLLDAQDSIAR
jgi:hypothetical protein